MKAWTRRLRREVMTVYFAARDPQTPWPLRLLALAVASYALSPIDLIPDFIPVLGYLDDLLLVPLGIWLVVRLLPPRVLAAASARAETALQRPRSCAAAWFVVLIWVLLGLLAVRWFLRSGPQPR
jgi:uncharacterized membrane protein YkvA (DUF1232 family)